MGKTSAPAAPDYSSIAAADSTAANDQLQLGQQELQFSQNQFNTVWPYAQQYLQQQAGSSAAEAANAANQESYFQNNIQPMETSYNTTAQGYNSPANANQQAGAAEADVANTMNASKASALSSLESYGIDPSQTRFGALDLSSNISQAAATAGAGTQSYLNTQATGLNLMGNAINVGMGYPSTANSTYGQAATSGSAGISAANSTTGEAITGNSGANAATGLGLTGLSNEAQALNMGYNNNLAGAQFDAQQSQAASQGIGQLVGGLGAAAMMMFM